jgi:uncharacterized protein
MSDLYVTWEQYHQSIEILAGKIYQSQWEFNQIVCLARGGLRIGDIFSRLYHKPLAILFSSSYDDDHKRDEVQFSEHLVMIGENLGNRVLIVDDLVDSGISLQKTIDWLKQRYPIEDLRTGVIWYKANSIFKPDYYVDYLVDNPWVHQPFEVYEQMTPADLVNRHQL